MRNSGGQATTKTFADYTLVPTAGPTQVTAGGGSRTFSFTTTPINGFLWPASVVNPIAFTTEPITPAVPGQPTTGLTSSVTATATGANLTVGYTAATPVGTYTIPIKAVGGGRTKYASVLLRIGPEAPSVLGLTPSASNSASQVFTLKAEAGSAPVFDVFLLFNTAVTGTNDCQIRLYVDGPDGWKATLSPPDWGTSGPLGPVVLEQAGAPTLNNGRCTFNPVASSWTGTATNLSWNLSLTRSPSWSIRTCPRSKRTGTTIYVACNPMAA